MAKKRMERPTELEITQEISARVANLPNCDLAKTVVVKDGPQTYKVATILQFRNPSTGEVTHHELRLNSFPFRVNGGIDYSITNRLAHWECRDHEIEQLRIFLESHRDVSTVGKHKVVDAKLLPSIEVVLKVLGEADLTTHQFIDLIQALAEKAHELRKLPELGEEGNARMVAAALRVAHRTNALQRLLQLIEEDAKEIAFQKLLDQNWWMLGGHYVWRIGKRHWTNRETVDIMLKSADGFFEIIELKRSSPQIFKLDHDQWIVTAEVNDAVNQAAQYISFIEMDRASIFKRFNVDLHKIKAKVLIGWIAEEDEFAKQKREALRIYNSHLHGIQVMTYDELVRVADNVINANMGESGQETFDEEIPF